LRQAGEAGAVSMNTEYVPNVECLNIPVNEIPAGMREIRQIQLAFQANDSGGKKKKVVRPWRLSQSPSVH
jgi:hypothetical protein